MTMASKFNVVCGFNGTTYSSHRSIAAAKKSAAKIKRSLERAKHQTGSLGRYVQVAPESAYFGRIHSDKNGDNPWSVLQARWSEVV